MVERAVAPPARYGRRALLGAAAALSVVALGGCGRSAAVDRDGPEPLLPWLTVVAASPVLADLTRLVGGSRVAVRALMPPTADPRRFVPGPDATDALVDADLILRFGLGLERGLDGVLGAAADTPRVTVTDAVPPDQMLTRADGAPNPYLWHDPTMLPWVVSRIVTALRDIDDDPVHGRAWDRNGVMLLNRIAEADQYVLRRVALVPPYRRALLTATGSFSWFARRYGFTATGLLDDASPYPVEADLARFADAISESWPVAVFADASIGTGLIGDAAGRVVGPSGSPATVVGPLYGSGLATSGYASRYLGMVRQNADRIVAGLTLPEPLPPEPTPPTFVP